MVEINLSDESIDKLAQAIAFYISQPEPLVDTAALSAAIGVTPVSIRRWKLDAKRNGFPFYQHGQKLMFKISEVRKWLRK